MMKHPNRLPDDPIYPMTPAAMARIQHDIYTEEVGELISCTDMYLYSINMLPRMLPGGKKVLPGGTTKYINILNGLLYIYEYSINRVNSVHRDIILYY